MVAQPTPIRECPAFNFFHSGEMAEWSKALPC